MDFLTDWLTNWLKELLIGGIMGNLEGLFDTVNTQVGEIAAQVGTTPAAWHAGVFSLIRQLSETVILPIAGMVLTFVATYELIQMLLEKNNMHEVDVANLYKWMFKTACAILILSNTFNIVMAVFDVSQSVIAQAGGLIQGSTDVSADMLAELETSLEAMDLGPLLGLWLQSALIGFTMKAMGIIIFVLVYGVVNAAMVGNIAAGHAGVCRVDDGIALERRNIALPEIQPRLNGCQVGNIRDTLCGGFVLQIGVLHLQKIRTNAHRSTDIHQPAQ